MVIISPKNGMEKERMELNRCSMKQLEEENNPEIYFSLFSSVKVNYEMQATKDE